MHARMYVQLLVYMFREYWKRKKKITYNMCMNICTCVSSCILHHSTPVDEDFGGAKGPNRT